MPRAKKPTPAMEMLFAIRELSEGLKIATTRLETQLGDTEKSAQLESLQNNKEKMNTLSANLAEELREVLGSDVSIRVASKIVDSLRAGLYYQNNGQFYSNAHVMPIGHTGSYTVIPQPIETEPAPLPPPPQIKDNDTAFSFRTKKSGGMEISTDKTTQIILYGLIAAAGSTIGIAIREIIGHFTHK